jgi:hypothetical protein
LPAVEIANSSGAYGAVGVGIRRAMVRKEYY